MPVNARSGAAIAWWVIAAGALVGPIVALSLVESPAPPETLRPAEAEESVRAVEVEHRWSGGGVLSLDWAAAPAAVTPALAGVTTDVAVTLGDVLEEGAVAMRVDNVGVIAAATDFPLYRPLTLGAAGEDVAELQAFLGRVGLLDEGLVPDAGVVDDATVDAIESLAVQLGAPAVEPTTFNPAWLLWMTNASFTVASVNVSSGAPPPPQGTPAFSGRPRLAGADLSGLDLSRSSVGSALLVSAPGLDPTRVTLTDGRVDDGLLLLEQALPESDETIEVNVTAEDGVRAAVLPAISVIVEADGAACAWVRDDDAGAWSRIDLVEAESVGGTVVVVDPDTVDHILSQDVLTDPFAAGFDRCR